MADCRWPCYTGLVQARELMHPDPEVLTPHDSVAKAARLMRGRGVAVLAVVEDRTNRKALGAVTDRHLLLDCIASGHDARRCPIWNHLQQEVARVPPERELRAPVQQAEAPMLERQPVLVVDAEGRLLGVIEPPTIAARVAVEVSAS